MHDRVTRSPARSQRAADAQRDEHQPGVPAHGGLSVQAMMAAGGNLAMVQLASDDRAGSAKAKCFPDLFVGGATDTGATVPNPNAKVTGVVIDVTGLAWDAPQASDLEASVGSLRRDTANRKKLIWDDVATVQPTTDLAVAGANALRVRAAAARASSEPGAMVRKHIILRPADMQLVREANAWLQSGFLEAGAVAVHEAEDDY